MGEGGVDGGDELAAHIGGVDALALEADIDAQLLQLPHCLQTVLGVPGEAGDGFNEDLVDEPPAAVRHHALEVLPLCGGGAGDALVGVDIHHAPLSLAGDQLGVVAVLRREGVELVIGVRADTGIFICGKEREVSMKFYDEQLQKLQEQIARKRQLEAQVSELRTQRSTLSTRVRELEAIKMQEQADVDKLEGRSLAAFFYNVIGKMDEQLNKEREEAYAARVKYDAAARELTAVEDELARYEAELSSLRDCERQYDAVLQEKAGAVKAAGGPAAEEILKLEERLAFLESQKRELREAVSAGNSALSTANHVLSSLDSAEGWGTWDLFGGGLISDLAKHSHLDEAQGNIEHLQSQLRRFKTELADVRISADMQVNVDGFLRFADYFFDGLFADWAVLDRINQSQEQVHSTKRQIENVLSRLNGMQRSVEQEQNQLESKLDTLVRDAKI